MADEPQNDTEALVRETAKLFKMLIVGRTDAYAFFSPSSNQWIAKREPLMMSHIREHLLGKTCIGTYMLTPDSTVRCIIFDVDLKDDAPYFLIGDADVEVDGDDVDGELDIDKPMRGNVEAALHNESDPAHRWAASLVLSTVQFIQNATHEILGLTSTPIVTGGGAHVIVPFGEEIPAGDARSMAHSVMDGIGIFTRKSNNFYVNHTHTKNVSVEVETFPKQDALKDPDSLGNLVRLPFGWHSEAQMRTYALDQRVPRFPSWKLARASSIDTLRLQANSLDLEWELIAS